MHDVHAQGQEKVEVNHDELTRKLDRLIHHELPATHELEFKKLKRKESKQTHSERGGGSVQVCGEKRLVPNGSVPINSLPQFGNEEWGLVDDEHPGANPDTYHTLCDAQEKHPVVHDPGKGMLINLAIGQCTTPSGCPLYRVFDKIPNESSRLLSSIMNDKRLLIAQMKGRSWVPLVTILDASGKQGMSFSGYADAVGACRWEYQDSPVGEPGSSGGFLVQCNVPAGDLFLFGQGQSMDCRNEDGDDVRLPASTLIQIRKDSCDLERCQWCATKDYNSSTRDAPDVLECKGGWNVLTSDTNPKGKIPSCPL